MMTIALFAAAILNLGLLGLVLRTQRIHGRRLQFLLQRPSVAEEVEETRRSVRILRQQLGKHGSRLKSLRTALVQQEVAMERRHDDAVRQLNCRVALTDLGLQFPLFLGDWAIDAILARELISRIEAKRPHAVLELGSGSSTVIIAATLKSLGVRARHVVVDHLEEFLTTTRRNLELQGLADGVEFLHRPLEPTAEGIPWYSLKSDDLGEDYFDLVLVDGPPSANHPRTREPAMSQIASAVRVGGVVLLDDTLRSEEAEIIERWRAAFPNFTAKISFRGKGSAAFERQA